MLRSICLAASLALALVGSQARADSFTPSSTNFGFSGFVDVDNGVIMNCILYIEVETDFTGSDAKIFNAYFASGGLCSLLNFSNVNYDIDVAWPPIPGRTATELRFSHVELQTLFSVCGPGTLTVTWYPSTSSQMSFFVATLPGAPSCTLSGTLHQWYGPALTITK